MVRVNFAVSACLTDKAEKQDDYQMVAKPDLAPITNVVKHAYVADQYYKTYSYLKGNRRLYLVISTRNSVNSTRKRFLFATTTRY